MSTGEQFVTTAAVLLGALMTHITNYMMERSRNRHQLLTRWDYRKLDGYEAYVDRVRASVYLEVPLYEHKERIRPSERPEQELLAEIAEATRLRGRAFE